MRSISLFGVLVFSFLSACSDESVQTRHAELETGPGGSSGEACSEEVFPNSLGLPNAVGESVGTSFTLTDVLIDHPLISPNDDGVHDDSRFVARAVVPNPGDTGTFSYAVDWELTIRSADSCGVVATQAGSVPVQFAGGSVELTEDWESQPKGTFVTTQFDGLDVSCTKNSGAGVNACVLLDSEAGGLPASLSTTDQGNILVVARNYNCALYDFLLTAWIDLLSGYNPPAWLTTLVDYLLAINLCQAAPEGGTVVVDFDEPTNVRDIGFVGVKVEHSTSVTVTRSNSTSTTYPVSVSNLVSMTEDDVIRLEFSIDKLAGISYIDTVEGSGSGDGQADILTLWDARDALGNLVPNDTYIFNISASLERSDATILETLESGTFGFIVDATFNTYSEFAVLTQCDPVLDPDGCACPVGATDCLSTSFGDLVTFDDPGIAGASFITTTYDPVLERYSVLADLQAFNGGGLIPKMDGIFATEYDLRLFVSELTGVPMSMDERLFNFDFTQLGVSTAVTNSGFSGKQFNNLLLDLITDDAGNITVGGDQTSLAEFLNSTMAAPAQYQIVGSRVGEECTESASFNGTDYMRASLCTYADAVQLVSAGDLGVYTFQAAAFGLNTNGLPSVTREEACTGSCQFRTYQSVGTFTVDSVYYTDNGTAIVEAYTETISATAPALVRLIDRGSTFGILSGQCARASVEQNDLRVLMTAADGAVGTNCIINGLLE